MKYYVMYDFDYFEIGGYGFGVFDNLEDAKNCIKDFLRWGKITDIDKQIILVKGCQSKLTPIDVVKEVEIN
jgi:hypothetical protein